MNLPPEGHKCFVRIGGENYHVRAFGDIRQIFYKGRWVSGDTFIDALWDEGRRDDVLKLAEFGHSLLKGEA